MRSTFWPNRICERQSSQNRHAGLKFSPKREHSALFMKILQNALSGSCAAGFGQIAFLWVNLLKIITLSQILAKTGKQCTFHENSTKRSFQVTRSTFWPNRIFERQSCQNRHTGLKFSPKRENRAVFMKILQNAIVRSCAARFGQIAFVSVKVLKIVTLASNSLQNGKTVRFSWKLYKTLFQVMRSTFWPNRIFERQSSKNRYTCLKFSPKRENSALSIDIVQNALFRSWAARFGQIAFLSGKVLTIVTLAWNLLQNGKTGRFT